MGAAPPRRGQSQAILPGVRDTAAAETSRVRDGEDFHWYGCGDCRRLLGEDFPKTSMGVETAGDFRERTFTGMGVETAGDFWERTFPKQV